MKFDNFGGGRTGPGAYDSYVGIQEAQGLPVLSLQDWLDSVGGDAAALRAMESAGEADASKQQAASLLTGTIYATAAAGAAATSDGDYYVVAGNGTDTYSRMFKNDGGTGVFVSDYVSSDYTVALDAREIKGRTGAALVPFESTADTTITVARGPGNGITVSWSALTVRLPSGITTVSALASTEVAPGEAIVIDLDDDAPYTPSVVTAESLLYQASLSGEKAILLQQFTNRFTGVLAAQATRALDNTARKKAQDARAWRVLDNTSSPAITTAVREGNGVIVGWSALRIATPSGERAIAARAAAELAPNKVLYVDTAEAYGAAYTVVEATYSASISEDDANGSKFILLHTGIGRFGGKMAGHVSRKITSEAVTADTSALADSAYKTTAQPVALAQAEQWLSPPGWNRGLAPEGVNAGSGYYQVQTVAGTARLSLDNVDTTLDFEYLEEGAEVLVIASGGGGLFFHADPLGETGNLCVLAANSVARVTQFGTRAAPNFLCEILAGSGAWTTLARPAMDQTIAFGGQSNASIAHDAGGIGGFSKRLLQRFTTNYPSTYWTDSATGGTSITGVNGWWNSGVPGAALTTYLDALDAAVAAGQPVPTETIWRQGEQDVTALNNGTLTTASYKAAVQAVFDHIRSYDGGTYSAMQFICSGPQARDEDDEFGGAMAARVAYIELADELDYVHADAGWYDVPRQYGNVHPYNQGYWIMGYRSATAWLIQQGETQDIGPEIGTVTLAGDGLSVTVQINGPTDDLVIPYGNRGPGADLGPYPFGWCAIAGDPRTAAPIPLTLGTIARVSGGELTLTLTSDTDLTGARLYTWSGKSADARRCNYIRSRKVSGPMLGYPMCDQRTGVLA